MTVLEQTLIVVIFVLTTLTGALYVQSKALRRLLERAQADRAAALRERLTHPTADGGWITHQTARLRQMTDELRQTRQTYITKEN